MNQKRFRRLHREEMLQVRKRGGRKRVLGVRGRSRYPPGGWTIMACDRIRRSPT